LGYVKRQRTVIALLPCIVLYGRPQIVVNDGHVCYAGSAGWRRLLEPLAVGALLATAAESLPEGIAPIPHCHHWLDRAYTGRRYTHPRRYTSPYRPQH
jgi:hypothetical protein